MMSMIIMVRICMIGFNRKEIIIAMGNAVHIPDALIGNQDQAIGHRAAWLQYSDCFKHRMIMALGAILIGGETVAANEFLP